MSVSAERIAVVTGAGQGIGKAIAEQFAAAGIRVVLAGRTVESLDRVRDGILESGAIAESLAVDLADDASIESFSAAVSDKYESIHVLVNCGGRFQRGEIRTAEVSDFDRLWQINVRGALALTRSLLEPLIAGDADIVFINSTSVFSDARGMGYFAATQHALQGIANTLRAELNDAGPRVLSVFPGRTATPRQEQMHEDEGKAYRPELLLQPVDVAKMVLACIQLPGTAEVMDLRIRPRQKH